MQEHILRVVCAQQRILEQVLANSHTQIRPRGNDWPILFRAVKVSIEDRGSNADSKLLRTMAWPSSTPCTDIFVELTNSTDTFHGMDSCIAPHPSLRDRARRINWIFEVKRWLSICTPRDGDLIKYEWPVCQSEACAKMAQSDSGNKNAFDKFGQRPQLNAEERHEMPASTTLLILPVNASPTSQA